MPQQIHITAYPGETYIFDIVGAPAPAPPPAAIAALPPLARGADISRHNIITDWVALARDLQFLFARATMGANGADSKFREYWPAAKNAGIPWRGIYHLFIKEDDPGLQLDNIYKFTKGDLGNLPMVLDVELRTAINETVPDEMKPRVADSVMKMVEIYENRAGHLPLIYTSKFMWAAMIGRALGERVAQIPLIVADYSGPIDMPFGWREWTFHQRGVISPKWATGNIDDDVYSGRKFLVSSGDRQ